MASPNQITVAQLNKRVGTHNAPVLIDVRDDDDFALDPQYIPTAIRCSHTEIAQLADGLKNSHVVVYCQKGLKLGEGASAVLRTYGVRAEVLQGGYLGWREAGLPVVAHKLLPPRNAAGQTVWVTRHRPKIDRIACPWLIRRFVDRHAQFLYVSASAVEAVAEKFNGVPFDVEGVFWSHREEHCTFDTMVQEFGLTTKPLLDLATIVRAADTNQADLAAESKGLLAASLGLSRMYSDDLEQLDAGCLLYDAFYRWCRDAQEETHDWPGTAARS
jgi:rhodanese-related sulfurtransferase